MYNTNHTALALALPMFGDGYVDNLILCSYCDNIIITKQTASFCRTWVNTAVPEQWLVSNGAPETLNYGGIKMAWWPICCYGCWMNQPSRQIAHWSRPFLCCGCHPLQKQCSTIQTHHFVNLKNARSSRYFFKIGIEYHYCILFGERPIHRSSIKYQDNIHWYVTMDTLFISFYFFNIQIKVELLSISDGLSLTVCSF